MHTHVYRSSSSNSEISAISAPTTQHHNYNPWTENSPWHQSEREGEKERENDGNAKNRRKRNSKKSEEMSQIKLLCIN